MMGGWFFRSPYIIMRYEITYQNNEGRMLHYVVRAMNKQEAENIAERELKDLFEIVRITKL